MIYDAQVGLPTAATQDHLRMALFWHGPAAIGVALSYGRTIQNNYVITFSK